MPRSKSQPQTAALPKLDPEVDIQSLVQTLLEGGTDMLLVVTPAFRVLGFNQATQKAHFQINQCELRIGDTILDYFRTPDVEAFKDGVAQAAKGETVSRLRKADIGDGKERWFQSEYKPLRNAEGSIYAVLVRSGEVTDRYQAQAALEATQRNLEMVLDTSPAAILIMDRKLNVLHVNRSAEELFTEFHGQRIIENGKLLNERIPPTVVEKFVEGFKLAIKGETIFQEFAHKDIRGNERLFAVTYRGIRNPEGEIYAVSHTALEITDLLKARKAAADSEAKFQTLLDQAPVAMAIVGNDSLIRRVNQSFVNLLGYRAEEIVGKSLLQLSPPEYREAEARYLANLVEAEWRNEARTKTVLAQTGERLEVMCNLQRVPGGAAEGEEIIVQLADIRPLKEVERNLRRAKEAAESADRAKTEFLANISHEIRNPLNSIVGMTRLLEDARTRQEQREHIQIIQNSANQLLRIVSDVLDMARMEAQSEFEIEEHPLSLHELMDVLTATYRPQAKQKGLDFWLSVDPDLPPSLMGDETRLQQVLSNLLSNALKFTERGSIKVRLDVKSHTRGACLLEFQVSDTGIGIQPDHQKKLFQKFWQADASPTKRYPGTGLGLAISKQLVERMGGTLSVESVAGEGTTFRIQLQLALADPGGQPLHSSNLLNPDGPAREGHQHNAARRILVVEDDPVNSMMLESLLRKQGYEVQIARNGHEALSRLADEQYELLLMDGQMPDMDGITAAQEIRRREQQRPGAPRVPIVAVSGYAMREDRDRFLRAGMDGFISKPIDIDQLLGLIKQLG